MSLSGSDRVGIITSDLAGVIHSANDRFLSMVGYDRGDLPLRSDNMTPPEWRPLDLAHAQELQRTGVSAEWEKEYLHKDGTRIPVRIAVSPLEGSRDQCVCIIQRLETTRDAQGTLRGNEHYFRGLFEQIPLMYFKMNHDGDVLAVNSYGAAELGYRPAELIGKPVLDVFHPEDRAAVLSQFKLLLEKPGKVARWEFRKRRKDGSVLWVRELARAVGEPCGDLAVLVACHDITTEREAKDLLQSHHDRLKVLTGRLARAEENERQRISAHLHDVLGQKLAMLKVKLGMLRAQPDARNVAGSLKKMEVEIDDLIAGTRSLTFELSSPILRELGLGPALRALCQQKERITEIQFAFDGSTRTELQNEPRMIVYRMVSELMFNAIKHAQCKRVTVSLLEDGGRLRILVADDGVGFDPGAIAEPGGLSTGFGLFNVREQLEQLSGSLHLDSRPGGGTRATVTIPFQEAR